MQGDYNFCFMQDGKPVEIKRSTELKIKLSKKQKEAAEKKLLLFLYFFCNLY